MIGKEKWSSAENLNIWFREDSSYDSRLETVKIYLKLKQLMIEIDDVDESSDEEGNKVSKSKISPLFFIIAGNTRASFFNSDYQKFQGLNHYLTYN